MYTSTPLDYMNSMLKDLHACVTSVSQWMQDNKLQMNRDKKEIILFGTQSKLTSLHISEVSINNECIPIATKVRNQGVILNNTLSMDQVVSHTRKTFYLELRKIANIRPLSTEEAAKQLVIPFVISKLDYCNSLLFAITQENMSKLQMIQNHAARIVKRVPKRSSASALLKELHWLPIS